MLIGISVDYARAYSARTLLQSALDSAALAAAIAKTQETDAESIARGEQVFTANFDGKLNGVTATPQIVINGQQVTATASVNMPNIFMGAFGYNFSGVGTRTEVMVPSMGKAEIVFVLDYSSSMDDQYEPMRDAAIAMIEKITLNQTNPDVKIGLVPFAKYVYGTLPGEYVLGGTPGVPWTNCTVGRKWPFVWNTSPPLPASPGSKWGRTDGDDDIEPDEYDQCDDHPDNNLIIRPMTSDHQGTIDQLNAMTPDSGTNVAVGMEFAFHLISPNPPWTEGVSFDDDEWQKVVILLTDGRHNKPGFGPGGIYTEDQGRENLDLICEEIKKEDVLVITVAYELDDEEGKEQLENCASASQYYLEGTEQNIASVFDNVGGMLIKALYITK